MMGLPYWFREIERRKVLKTTQRGCEIVWFLKETKARGYRMFTIFIAKLSIRYYCPLFSFCCVLDCGKRVTILSSCKSSYHFEVVNGKVRKLWLREVKLLTQGHKLFTACIKGLVNLGLWKLMPLNPTPYNSEASPYLQNPSRVSWGVCWYITA